MLMSLKVDGDREGGSPAILARRLCAPPVGKEESDWDPRQSCRDQAASPRAPPTCTGAALKSQMESALGWRGKWTTGW